MAKKCSCYYPNGMVDVNVKYKNIINNLPWGDKDKVEFLTEWVIGMIYDYHNPNHHNDLFYRYDKSNKKFITKNFTTSDIDWFIQWKIPGQTMMKWVRLGLIELVWKSKSGNTYKLPDDFLGSNDPNIQFISWNELRVLEDKEWEKSVFF